MATSSFAQSEWQRTRWHDEPAWVSRSGELEAIVSETRCRVIYIGPADTKQNLLSAPHPMPAATAEQPAPNWGGHRFWLGPQSRWKWPPVVDWEFSAAAAASASGPVLRLEHPQTVPGYPQLRREYAWEGDRLRCTVEWSGGSQPFYGMHVFAVDTPAELNARLVRWDRVPQGVVRIKGDAPDAVSPLPHPAVTVEGDQVSVKNGIETVKLGFAPQPIPVRRGSWLLELHPGPHRGTPLESPDYGYLSQIWVGDGREAFAEIEQLTPFLLPVDDGTCSSTVYLTAKRL